MNKLVFFIFLLGSSNSHAIDFGDWFGVNYSTVSECVYKESKNSSKTVNPNLVAITRSYCSEVVAKKLSSKCGFKIADALKDGYSYSDIAEYLEKGCGDKQTNFSSTHQQK